MSPAFEAFVAPARRRPALWRLVLGVLVMLVVTVLWFVVIFGGVWLWSGVERMREVLAGMMQPSTPAVTLLLLATFIGMAMIVTASWIARPRRVVT